jgi:ornithine cyclodeaminase/alanine dehydrogenase-like protein (mu-crystallin family)
VPLYLTEADVASLVDPAGAVPVLEECFVRMAAGEVELMPRRRFRVEDGSLAVMAAADIGLGIAGSKSYMVVDGRAAFVVSLFSTEDASLVAVIEADRLGQVRTGAASGVAAKFLSRAGAASVGLIGSGWQAESQLAAIRAAVPTIESALVWSRSPEKVAAFCAKTDAEPAESSQDVAACDVVVTATTSKDPVLRGEWLREGALVCAIGANDGRARELDNAVLQRASFVCCDSLADAKLESGDLIEPVATGVLDWLEVHELQEVVAGETSGRQANADIVVFKSNGIAPWDVALGAEVVRRARESGVGREL